MGFGKNFRKELGKNTGKWVSNKLFGNNYATPYRIIQEQKRKEREDAKNYRQQQKEIEKERKKREKELAQLKKELAEQERQEIIQNNIKEVKEHNNYIEVIQSVHKDFSKKIDWENMLNIEEPAYVLTEEESKDEIIEYCNKETENNIKYIRANVKLSPFNLIFKHFSQKKLAPVFNLLNKKYIFYIILLTLLYSTLYFSKYNFIYYIFIILIVVFVLLRQGAKDYTKVIELEKEVEKENNLLPFRIENKLNEQKELHQKYLMQKEDFDNLINLSNNILNKNPDSFLEAIKRFNIFEDLKEYGSNIDVKILSVDNIKVDFFVHSDKVIPNCTKSILRKGLEVKEDVIPVSKFNGIYQDYVCSCILRISKEIFQLLPYPNQILINAKGNILNTSLGKFEEKIVVSIIVDRQILDRLNFNLIDPSDSLKNFTHNMCFNDQNGFSPVDELTLS